MAEGDWRQCSAFTGNEEKAYEYLRILNSTYRWKAGLQDLILINPLFDNLKEEEEFHQIVDQAHKQIAEIREEILAMEGI